MRLTEEDFATLVDAGCLACGGKKLSVRALVTQKLVLLGGEPHGAASWAYKGEDLVRGTYRITCDGCRHDIFTASACPRCDAANGVDRALQSENTFPLLSACANCKSEMLTASVLVPALVTYDGKRTGKPRTVTAPQDEGFHAFRLECKECHNFSERREPCPLCGAP